MLKREDYLQLIEDIRNTEKKSLDEYIDKVLEPLRLENVNFIETLYKDIHYLIKDIDKEGEGDLDLESGDVVFDDEDFKVSGYQSRLDNLSIWLHSEVANKFIQDSPFQFVEKMQNFEKNFLDKPDYTPEYKAKLDKIKRSLRRERKQNLGEKGNFLKKLLDWDHLELKPNIAGIGININEIINKFRK